MFIFDKYYQEDITAFQFNLSADIDGLFNWNTNMIFASVVCTYETEDNRVNQVTVWD